VASLKDINSNHVSCGEISVGRKKVTDEHMTKKKTKIDKISGEESVSS
jgi:hypothetical protein